MMYNLIKLSSPGFDLHTEHLEVVRDILDTYVCGMCKKNHSRPDDFNFPSNYRELFIEQQVDALLGTDCGCEFMLEENEDKQHQSTDNHRSSEDQ